MKTSKFFAKLILALVPALLLVAFTAAMPMCYMDEEYPAWRYTMDVVSGKASGDAARTVILGDSRAMADLIPEKLGDSCVNLAVGGATPVEMYYFYSDYLKNNPAPETVIVMFAPFHYSYMDNYKTRTTYFNALSTGQKIEVTKNAKACGADAALFEDYVPYSISCRLRLPDVYLPAIYNARFVGRKSVNEAAYANLAKSKGQGYFGTDDGNSDVAYEASYTQMADDGNGELLTIYMEKMLALLDESGAYVILEQPPMNTTTYEKLDSGYIAEYDAYIEALCAKYDNITYSSEMIEYGCEYFGDSSHLNEKGANKFSQEFCTKYNEFL